MCYRKSSSKPEACSLRAENIGDIGVTKVTVISKSKLIQINYFSMKIRKY